MVGDHFSSLPPTFLCLSSQSDNIFLTFRRHNSNDSMATNAGVEPRTCSPTTKNTARGPATCVARATHRPRAVSLFVRIVYVEQ